MEDLEGEGGAGSFSLDDVVVGFVGDVENDLGLQFEGDDELSSSHDKLNAETFASPVREERHHILGSEARLSGRRLFQRQGETEFEAPEDELPIDLEDTSATPFQFGGRKSSRFASSFATQGESNLLDSDPGDHAFYTNNDAFFLPSGLIGDWELPPERQAHNYALQQQRLQQLNFYGHHDLSLGGSYQQLPQHHPAFTPLSSSYPPSYDQDPEIYDSELDQSVDDLCWDGLTDFVDHLDSPHRSGLEARRSPSPRFINIANPPQPSQASASKIGEPIQSQTIGVSMALSPEQPRRPNPPSQPPSKGGVLTSPPGFSRKAAQLPNYGPGLLASPPRGGGPATGRFRGSFRGGFPRGSLPSQGQNFESRYRANQPGSRGFVGPNSNALQKAPPKASAPAPAVRAKQASTAPLPPATPVGSSPTQPAQQQKRRERSDSAEKKKATPSPQAPKQAPTTSVEKKSPAKNTSPSSEVLRRKPNPKRDSTEKEKDAHIPSVSVSSPAPVSVVEPAKPSKKNTRSPAHPSAATATALNNSQTTKVPASSPVESATTSTSATTSEKENEVRPKGGEATVSAAQSMDSSPAAQKEPPSVSKPKPVQRSPPLPRTASQTSDDSSKVRAKKEKTKPSPVSVAATSSTPNNAPTQTTVAVDKVEETAPTVLESPKKKVQPATPSVIELYLFKFLQVFAVFGCLNSTVGRGVRTIVHFHKTALGALTRSYYVAFTFLYVYFFPWLAYSLKSVTYSAPAVSWYLFLAWFLTTKRCCNMPNLRLLPLLFVFDGVCDPRYIALWNGSERLVFALVLLTVKSHQDMLSRNCYLSVSLLLFFSVVVGAYALVQWVIFVASLYTFNVCLTNCPVRFSAPSSAGPTPNSTTLTTNANGNGVASITNAPAPGTAAVNPVNQTPGRLSLYPLSAFPILNSASRFGT